MTLLITLFLNELRTQLIFQPSFQFSFEQSFEVWPLHFPFHNIIKETVPPSEACLCGCIIWNLMLVQQPPLCGMPQLSTYVEMAKLKLASGLTFKAVCATSSSTSSERVSDFDTELESSG